MPVSRGMAFGWLLHQSLRLRDLPWPVRWLFSALLVLVAFGLRYAAFGPTEVLPFLFFFPAIILASVLLDRGSGFVAVAVSTILATYAFFAPHFELATTDTKSLVSAILFVITGAFIAAVTEALHTAYVRAERAQAQTRAALARAEAGERERELLLAEFAHRTKNDMQRITATMQMQANVASPEVALALRAAADRVRVVARVHDALARRDGHMMVDAQDFLQALVADLRAGAADLQPVELRLEAEPHVLSISRAGAVGLVVNELVTNALKHAFPEGRAGAISVAFRREGPDYQITVADDGVGLPPGSEPQREGGLGQRLIRALAAQLGGTLRTEARDPSGLSTSLRFPAAESGAAES